jgi:SAM-dependent methyltransferase
MGLKVVLSRLPVSYATWSRLGAFRHSFLTDANKVVHTARAHVERYRELRGKAPRCMLELGPGELTTRAVTYAALGVARIIFVDVGDFGANDVAAYEGAAKLAEESGLAAPSLQDAQNRAEIFQRCRTEYLRGGLADLAKIASGQVDLIVSDAVLEHVRKRDFLPLLHQLRRIAAQDAVALHGIDFHDHLGGGLQNLRFSDATWESEWMARSGFYTNRISPSGVIDLMQKSGFQTSVRYRLAWPQAALRRDQLYTDLRASWSDHDLHTAMLQIQAEPALVQ